jgi:putative Holliday junction resolvase
MRILGIDWGESKVGIAVSDPLGITAQPLPYIKNDQSMFVQLKAIIEKFEIEIILLGYPRQMSGKEGIAASKVRSFCENIKNELNIPVNMWDERLTTKMAEKSLINAGISREKRKELVDSISASMMLQSYMDSSNNNEPN